MLTLEDALKLNPGLNTELFFPAPQDVFAAIQGNPIVRRWLSFIAERHEAPHALLLLFVPCDAKKPYEPPRSEFFRRLLELERRINGVRAEKWLKTVRAAANSSNDCNSAAKFQLHLYICAVSEPLALEPREFWDFRWRLDGELVNLIYDAPFFPWIERYGYKWDENVAKKVWRTLNNVVRRWFVRNGHKFKNVLALACPNSGYRRILSGVVTNFVPSKCPEVEETYEENVSRVYTQDAVWNELLDALRRLGVLS
ncbi:MAG: hypothetical protein OD814_001075 [Candidatus Alkanophagales archaeon MCA70_species_1]|nr:hypothetical protein [Candidatus Alkanophaga volatiphilum]